MPTKIKKINTYRQPLWRYLLSPKRATFLLIAAIIFTGFALVNSETKVSAATGINQTINFQGKVVNSNGTNVADGQYTFVFKIYDAASGGSNPWTETQNNVQVTAGVFRVSLGSVTPITGVDFNTDNIYLGINFNSDGEMTPRVRFASVPYAFNAQSVAGLTVTNTTGTLTIPNSKTISFGGAFSTSAQDLTLTLSGATNVTLPTTGTLATLAGVENLSNKTFTTTMTVNGVTTDISTGTNEDLSIIPNGTGKVNINTTSGAGSFNIRPNGVTGGTLSIASVSGSTAFAALLVDNNGSGDIFTASTSGVAKFTIKNDGTFVSSNYTANGGILYTQTNGIIAQSSVGNPGQCLQSNGGGTPTWGACGSGSGTWAINTTTGIHAPINNTLDLLVGASTTDSAKFAIIGVAGSTMPTASISAQNVAGQALVLGGDGSIQSVRNNTLTLGGTTTGNILLRPSDGGSVTFTDGTNRLVSLGDDGDEGRITLYGQQGGEKAGVLEYEDGGVGNGYLRATATGSNNYMFEFHDGANYLARIGTTNNKSYFSYGIKTDSAVSVDWIDQNLYGYMFQLQSQYSTAQTTALTGFVADLNTNWTIPNSASGNQTGIAITVGDGGTSATSKGLTLTEGGSNGVDYGLDFSGVSRFNTAAIYLASGGNGTAITASANAGGQAAFILNKTGIGDIFAASASGTTKFVIKNDGTASSSAGFTIDGAGNIQSTNNQLLSLGGSTTGDLRLAPRNGSGILNLSTAATNGIKINGTFGSGLTSGNTCVSDIINGLVTGTTACSAQSSPNFWQYNTANGIVANGNLTTDLLLGGTTTTSAKFAVTGIAAGTNPTASVSATSGSNNGNGIVIAGDGSIQTLRNNNLILGGNTTGNVTTANGNNFVAGQTTGKVAFGGPVSTSDYLASITGDTTQNWSTLLNLSQANNSDEDSSVINITNTVNVGALSGGVTRKIYNMNSSLTPTVAVDNNVNHAEVYNTKQSLDMSNVTFPTLSTNNSALGYGNYIDVSGTPALHDTGFGDYQAYGQYALVNVNPTYTSPASPTFTTYGARYTNTSGTAGVSGLTAKAYGVYAEATGNLTTTGTTTHYAGYFDVSGTADVNYGLYVNGAASATSNYGLYINSVAVGNSNYAIYSNAAAKSYIGGSVGIGTTTPLTQLHINALNSAGNAAMIVDQRSAGPNDIFAASASGVTKFVIKNDGTASSSAGFTIDGVGNIQSTKNQTLTVGGNSTGNILLRPRNGLGFVGINTANPTSELYLNGTQTFEDVAGSGNTGSIKYTTGGSGGSGGFTFVAGATNNISYDFRDGGNSLLQIHDTGQESVFSYDLAVNGNFNTGGALTEFWNAAPVITTGTNTNLTISPNGSGNLIISTDGNTGLYLGSSTNTPAALSVSGGIGLNAAFILNQTNSGDIFAASASGITKFVVKNDGTASSSAGFTITSAGNIQSMNNGQLTLGGATTGDLLLLPRNGSGILNLSTAATSGIKINGTFGSGLTSGNTCISDIVNGFVTGTTACTTQSSPNFWQYSTANGIVANGNLTTDILIGGTSTQSAQFAVLGIAAGTNPSASVSAQNGANANKGIYLSGDGSIQSVRRNTLTIGGSTTGSIQFNPGGLTNPNLFMRNNGDIGIGSGNTTPLATLDVRYNTANNGGTNAVASVSGRTSNATLLVDNSGLGDVFAASTGGMTQFVITSSGSVGIGLGGLASNRPTAKLDVNGAASIASQLTFRSGTAGTITTSSNSTLTLGGGTTGNVLINPLGGAQFGIGTMVPIASIDLRASLQALGGTQAVASISGKTSYSALAVDNWGIGDIFTASSSSNTQFVITNGGAVGIGNAARIPTAQLDVAGSASISSALTFRAGAGTIQTSGNGQLFLGGSTTGDLVLAPRNGSGILNILAASANGIKINNTFGTGLTSGNSCVTDIINGLVTGVAACAGGGGGNFWQYSTANGIVANGNLTTDLLVGGTSTQSASFSILGIAASDNPTASISAQSGSNATKGLYMAGDGSLQSVRNNTLTIGGNTTGEIQFKPGNSSTSLYLKSNGTIQLPGYTTAAGLLYVDGSGNVAQVVQGGSGLCLIGNGSSAPGWGGCTSGGAANNWWTLNSAAGTVHSLNTTLDTLFGGTSTSSAGFRISGATKNYGTVAAASVSANTSYAGFVVDNRGSGDLFTASSSGLTRFTIFQGGNVTIGNTGDQGYKLDVQGSVRIGNNTTSDDIVKQTTADFTVSGSAISTNDGVNTVSTSGNQLKLVTDLIGAGATLTAPAAGSAMGLPAAGLTQGFTFQRPDKKFVFIGNGTRIYNPTTDTWGGGPAMAAAAGAGVIGFQRPDGRFLIVMGNSNTTTNYYDPANSTTEQGAFAAGPATTGNVGAGSLIIRRTDGKVLLIHGGAASTTSLYDPTGPAVATSILGSFTTGPATTTTVTTGSVVFPRPDGKWVLMYGGASSQATAIYDPSLNGGSFVTGPTWTSASATNAGAGSHAIQLPDGRFLIFLGGGSGVTVIYSPDSNSFSTGPTLAGGDAINSGAHSFQRSDGQWITVIGSATNSKTLQKYDPSANSFTQLTGANGLQGATGAGPGSHTIQRPDGKYIIIHGASTSLTTLYDAGWNTTGTWTSEDILNTKISTYSAMTWSANPQSANNNARIDSETINFSIKTGDTLTSLGNNDYRNLQDNGDLIKAYGNSQYAKIQVSFSTPIRSYVGGATGLINQSNIWNGSGGTFYRRSFIQPTVYSMRVQNPLVSYGDPTSTGDPAFGRNFATASATLEGVVTDNSNRLSLATLRNFPTASASAGFIIASASANLGGNAGAGAHTIERNNGTFLTILGNSLTTTRVYDTDTNTWSAGPTLPAAAGAGAHSFLMPDGRFFVVLGGTTNLTAIYDPQANVFFAGPNLIGNVGIGSNSFQLPNGFYMILNGGATPATNILDPFTMAVTQGPFTSGATPNVGGGSFTIRREDGRVIVVLGNANAIATGTNIYDPATNAFAAGPALVGGTVSTGGNAVQLPNRRVIVFKSTATSNLLDPITSLFAAGAAATANGAGSFIIPRSDGKILKSNGGNAATTNVYDPTPNTVLTGTSAPTLPCNVNTGGHVFQRPTGEFVVICGGATASTTMIDAGWNLGGTYTTEQIYEPLLSGITSLYWKNAGQGNITVKYRTAATKLALGTASWKDEPTSGSYLSITPGDVWIQLRFDLQGELNDLPGAKTRVWTASDSGGGMVYYRQVQTPVLQYWKLMNVQDPTLLTLTSGGNNIFRFSSDGQAYTSENGAWNSGGADLAERYSSKDTLQAGEVVSLDRLNSQHTKRSTLAYDQNAMGVVSTQPGFVAGAYTADSYPIALVGRVPVKISTENGSIKAGDYLTSASIPGYAMKATVAGRVIGQAMEDFDAVTQSSDCPKYGAGSFSTTTCGTITVFVNLTSYNGQSVDVAVKESGFALKEDELPLIAGVDFSQGTNARRQQDVLGFLKTQKDNGQAIYTDRVAATQEVISPTIITDLLIAKKIKAESIEGLEILTNNIEQLSNRVATGSALLNFTDRLTLLAQNQTDFQNQMASLSAKLDRMGAINILDIASHSSGSSELTMVSNLGVYGTTTLSEASVLNTLTIGSGTSMSITANSIDTVGEDLSIQGLKQGGVSFLGGLITFDIDGKARFAEDVAFEKNVAVSGVLSARTVATTDLQLGQGTTTVISDTEVTATGAAGLVVLKRNNDHVKINNPLVKTSSFIFITPKTRTTQSLFLIDQVEGDEEHTGSFTVGLDGRALDDIKFNYLIVN